MLRILTSMAVWLGLQERKFVHWELLELTDNLESWQEETRDQVKLVPMAMLVLSMQLVNDLLLS